MMKLIIVAACLVSVCTAHMCLISPRQRGSMQNLNTAGSDDCILTKSPCGGRSMQSPETVWASGGNFTVVFQKNLDHWDSSNPGYFGVSLINGAMTKELVRVPDAGEKSLHIYTASGVLPALGRENFVLQVTYVPHSSDAPAVFYQCADVMVQ